MTKPPYQINSSLRKNYPAHHPQESGGGMVDDVVPISLGGTGATTASQARTNLGLGSAATEDSSAFLQPTITTTVTFNLPPSSNNKLMDLQQGYGIYSDNTGAGSHNSRLWFDGPNGGEVLVGPRSGASFLHQIRLRANTTRIEGNCVVTGSSLTIDGSAAYHRGNILGSVAQSGGVPTGAIIERGSNANGEYVRFADGTQICHFYGTVTNQTISNAYGSSGLFIGERTWTFPAQFASSHIVAFHQGRYSTGASWSSLATVTTTTANFRFIDINSRATGFNMLLNYVAIGRWF